MSQIYLHSQKFHKNQQVGKREQPDQGSLLRKGSYILAPSRLCWASASWSMSIHTLHQLLSWYTRSCGNIRTPLSMVWLIRGLGDKCVKKSRTVYRKPGIAFPVAPVILVVTKICCPLLTNVHLESFQIFQLENLMVRWSHVMGGPLKYLWGFCSGFNEEK